MTSTPISRHFYDVLTPKRRTPSGRPTTGGRAQEYMDLLDSNGSVMQTIKVGSPAPIDTVAAAVERANHEQEDSDGSHNA